MVQLASLQGNSFVQLPSPQTNCVINQGTSRITTRVPANAPLPVLVSLPLKIQTSITLDLNGGTT
jgi:hypothetical protein